MTRGWRAVLPIHPVAEIFPAISPEELKELAASIRQVGMQQKVLLWDEETDEGPITYLLDGRGRLDAIKAKEDIDLDDSEMFERLSSMSTMGPAKVVIAVNIRRRHLTPRQKVLLADKAIQAEKEFRKPDRQSLGAPVPQPHGGAIRKGSPKSRVGEVAEAAGVSRETARKHLKKQNEAEQERPWEAETKESNPKPKTPKASEPEPTVLPVSDVPAAEVLKLLKKIDTETLSEKGWKALDQAMERLSELYDLKGEGTNG